MPAKNTSQKKFLLTVHNMIANSERAKKKVDREKLELLAMSILLLLDSSVKGCHYRLTDTDTGEVISGGLFDAFRDEDPYKAVREYLDQI